MLARSKRSAPGQYYYPQAPPPNYGGGNYGNAGYGNGGYQDEDCQYHTLVNGDSEMILHKLLPFRMVGRTILRHCIKPP